MTGGARRPHFLRGNNYMQPSFGININCNSNCSRWCPRVLSVFCCCGPKKKKKAHQCKPDKVHESAKKVFSAIELSNAPR